MVAPSRREDVSASLEPTFPLGLRFTCTRCGACCKHVGAGVGVTQRDSAKLGNLVEQSSPHPIFAGVLGSQDGVCSSLSGDDCSIYESRPLMCKLYPFYIGVRADGTLQLSVDHCPGVDLPDAELVDVGYLQREIAPALAEDAGYLTALRSQITPIKGDTYPVLVGRDVEVRTTWGARDKLWSSVFSLLETRFPDTFTPRDRLECLKAELVHWIEENLLGPHNGTIIDEEGLERSLAERSENLHEAVAESAVTQERHRQRIQTEGSVMGEEGVEGTSFHTRTGESFTLGTRDVLRMRAIDGAASDREMNFLKEIVKREFVYQGVVVPSLTFREEASLLYYVSDAIELLANAAAVRRQGDAVGVDDMNFAICETDAHMLTTVQQLGVNLATGWQPG